MRFAKTSICMAALAFATHICHAQDGIFRTWFEVPTTVMPGEVFEVEMWASFEGDLLNSDGWFGAAAASVQVSGDQDSFAFVTPLTESMMLTFSAGTIDGNWLRDFVTGQSRGFPGYELDLSNPIRVLAFDIGAGTVSGELVINLEPHSDYSVPALEWSVDGRDDYVSTLDPNIALIATPSVVHVSPTPASLGLLAIAGLGAMHRRR